jgi:hypothetical protein
MCLQMSMMKIEKFLFEIVIMKTFEEKREIRKANKEKLIEQVIDMIENDQFEYERFTYDLCREALKKWTNRQLKGIL